MELAMRYFASAPARTGERTVGRFQVQYDDGEVYTVITFQEFMEMDVVRPAGEPAQWAGGRKRLALSDGSPVNQIDAETFQVLDTNRIARKIN
jgi:hypothetical protein